ncbi:MAG: signal peptidase I, partial [Planctomycetota bacterium]
GGESWIRDNLEAVAVAIIMALLIRHFCVEAFRIPTNSMRPTLNGKEVHGDRILVDKFAYLRRDPRRFEVAVFQYPLHRTRSFIKRIAGLPGERLCILDGDVWTSSDGGVRWSIARKPRGAREELFFAYYPVPVDSRESFVAEDREESNWDCGPEWRVDEPGRRFDVDAGEAEAALTFLPHVLPYDRADAGRDASTPYVGDVRISFRVAVERGGELALRITEHGRRHRLLLSAAGSRAEVGEPEGTRKELGFRLVPGREHSVSFANVDDTLWIELDGEETKVEFPRASSALPEDPPSLAVAGSEWWHHEISLAARGLRATLADLALARDIYYLRGLHGSPGKRIYEIPDGHYFMLGDNTGSSADSREWRVTEARLEDGTVIRWESGQRNVDGVIVRNPESVRPYAGTVATIVVEGDVDGLVRRFANSDVKEWLPTVDRPFVPRGHLVGRAFSVFWPFFAPPLYAGPSRVKLIR